MNTETENKIVTTNIIASINIFNDRQVKIIAMHLSDTRPKQFEDNFGNLWNASELSNFIHIK